MKNRIEFISFEEFTQLMKKCDDKELKLAMLLGFGSGLRISEVLRCSPEHFQGDKLFIPESKV
jgi:integrase